MPSTTLAMSIQEAARRIGVGETLLRGLVKQGRVPIVRLGRRVLILEADLQGLLRQNREHVSTDP